MQRRSAITGLVVEASRVIHEMVSVLSKPECGEAMRAVETAARMVALWRTRAVISRLDFVGKTLVFVDETNYVIIYGGQG